jgi:hypothetical protein
MGIKETLAGQLAEAVKAQAAMNKKLEPLREKQAAIVAKIQPLEEEKRKVDAQIRAITAPEKGDSEYELAMTISTLTAAVGSPRKAAQIVEEAPPEVEPEPEPKTKKK